MKADCIEPRDHTFLIITGFKQRRESWNQTFRYLEEEVSLHNLYRRRVTVPFIVEMISELSIHRNFSTVMRVQYTRG